MRRLVIGCVLALLSGAAMWGLCRLVMVDDAIPFAPTGAGYAATAFVLSTVLAPPVRRIASGWLRTLCLFPLCWLWGLSVAVMAGSVIDCFVCVGPDPVAVFPFGLFFLPLFSILGLLPGCAFYGYLEGTRTADE